MLHIYPRLVVGSRLATHTPVRHGLFRRTRESHCAGHSAPKSKYLAGTIRVSSYTIMNSVNLFGVVSFCATALVSAVKGARKGAQGGRGLPPLFKRFICRPHEFVCLLVQQYTSMREGHLLVWLLEAGCRAGESLTCQETCVATWRKCAGEGIPSNTIRPCCSSDDHCVRKTDTYSQCRPKSRELPESWPLGDVLTCTGAVCELVYYPNSSWASAHDVDTGSAGQPLFQIGTRGLAHLPWLWCPNLL